MSVCIDYNHCFLACIEGYCIDYTPGDPPAAVIISDAKFQALFPSDPNDCDSPTTDLCVKYADCCYCEHSCVFNPVNVDEDGVTADAATVCADCDNSDCGDGVDYGGCDPKLRKYYKVTITGCAGVFAYGNGEHILRSGYYADGRICWYNWTGGYPTNPIWLDHYWGVWEVSVRMAVIHYSGWGKQWRGSTSLCGHTTDPYIEYDCFDWTGSCAASAGATCVISECYYSTPSAALVGSKLVLPNKRIIKPSKINTVRQAYREVENLSPHNLSEYFLKGLSEQAKRRK